MKKLSQNRNLKIISATSVTLFSLLTVFSATFAWFSMNEQVGNNGQQVQVQPISGYFYKLSIHNAVTISDTEYKFNQNPWGTIQISNWNTRELVASFDDDDSCFMGSYDYLEKIHPVLFLFEFGDENVESYTATSNEPITIKASTETSYYLGDNAVGRTISSTGNPLSSVVRYSSSVFSSESALEEIKGNASVTLSDGVTTNTYDTYDFTTNKLSGLDSFVKFNDQHLYSSFDQEPVIYSTDSATVKYIAVVFDYYELAMETIYGAFLGDEALEDTLGFECDWTMVVM